MDEPNVVYVVLLQPEWSEVVYSAGIREIHGAQTNARAAALRLAHEMVAAVNDVPGESCHVCEVTPDKIGVVDDIDGTTIVHYVVEKWEVK